MMTEVEVGARQPRAVEHPGWLFASRSGKRQEGSSLEPSEGARPSRYLHFELLASRTEKINFCYIRLPSFVGLCSGSPRKVTQTGSQSPFLHPPTQPPGDILSQSVGTLTHSNSHPVSPSYPDALKLGC